LFRFIFINLDRVREEAEAVHALYDTWRPREAVLLGDPPPKAASFEEVRSLSNSLGLAARLNYLSYRRAVEAGEAPDFLALRFDAVFNHELQHLSDARRFLPVMSHLLVNLYHFIAMGLSAFRAEAWLEERAQLRALAYAEDPYAALAQAAAFLESDPSRSAHGRGYTDLLRQFVDYLADHPDLYPELDRSAVLVHQLFRLSAEDIRSIAEHLAKEDDL
jgi:hypothetical protein